MITVNLQNIENLIFQNTDVRDLFPDLRHIFDQWLLSQRIPSLRSLKTRSLIDLLNSFNQDHITILNNYFEDSVTLDRIDYHIVKNIDLPLDFNPDILSEYKGFNNLVITRDGNKVHISFWR